MEGFLIVVVAVLFLMSVVSIVAIAVDACSDDFDDD